MFIVYYRTLPFIISFIVISVYSFSTGPACVPFAGRGGGGKQFRSFVSLRPGPAQPQSDPLAGVLAPDEDAELGVGDFWPGGNTFFRK